MTKNEIEIKGSSQTVYALTVLWALVESGLGGILHALHIPVTGYVLGGFSVVCISLIAYYSHSPYKSILTSLLFVLATKALVNPFSSQMAYIAVAFQGILGSIVYHFFKPNAVSVFMYATLCMLESAFQKVLVLMLFFGKDLFTGLDALLVSLQRSFHLSGNITSKEILIVYGLSYVIWSVFITLFTLRFPSKIASRQAVFSQIKSEALEEAPQTKKRKKYYWLIGLLIITMSSTFLVHPTQRMHGLYLLTRTVVVLVLWIYLVSPLIRLIINTQIKKANKQQLEDLWINTAQLKSYIMPLYRYCKANYTIPRRFYEFLLGIFAISINLVQEKDR